MIVAGLDENKKRLGLNRHTHKINANPDTDMGRGGIDVQRKITNAQITYKIIIVCEIIIH